MDAYLQTAIKAAKDAGMLFKKNFGHPKNIQTKDGNKRNLVTEIDFAIERLIKKQIFAKFPKHKVIGEELGWDKLLKNDFVWIIDPIDGTSNFIQGLPFCCISIALWQLGKPLVGVVYNPITEDLFFAAKGKGAFRNGKKIQVSKTNSINRSYGSVGWGRSAELGKKIMAPFIKSMKKTRALGSSALEACLVASGNFDCFVQGCLSIWDLAASSLILTEAGGRATDWQGKSLGLDAKNLVASNGRVHKELLKLIKKL